MFSGLVQEVGKITQALDGRIGVRIKGPKPKKGDSIAINGVCLTVVKATRVGLRFDVSFDLSQETLARTTLKALRRQDGVNVERALSVADALGGHIVQGHVDGTGRLVRIQPAGDGAVLWFEAPPGIMDYIVPKGSITVDGVSLTVVEISSDRFSAALIPFTLEHTTLGSAKEGDPVNLEADIIAKYVRKYTKPS
jgi:riboflavin synthase